ncbi:hypothetical protein [Clavibacter sp.]|uniref:hypothetical protein n=1 Tax=Clavibacter sp. TaxID=1871044 RepID=UPI0019C70A8C|nr:hypothetical protein [Clavibacter sp.]MBD5381968.1 hypothetical protein [Clavibacter sp.]
MKKKRTRKELEELREDVINKQQELIKMQEIEIARLKEELRMQQAQKDFDATMSEQQARLYEILGLKNSSNPLGGFPKVY